MHFDWALYIHVNVHVQCIISLTDKIKSSLCLVHCFKVRATQFISTIFIFMCQMQYKILILQKGVGGGGGATQ